MRRNVNNSVETVNAAASAIVSAESRVQPSSVEKRRWGSCWNVYCCFGSQKNNKRIGHAVLAPEPVASSGGGVVPVAAPVQNSSTNNSTSIFLPFIAPPSSPASFLQSGPSSVSHTPASGLLSLTLSRNNEPPSAFEIGPYANETQPVTPPVFSSFTTEPSTAPLTPPPESATPSSPEVPFAQLLTSSLELARRNTGGKFSAAHYEFQSYQVYPGSPGGGNLISPGSVVSNSGTSSPYPGKCSIIEFRIGEPPKFLGYEHFMVRKWGSRFGSGNITPAGQGSRLGSGALTPNGVEMVSRIGSGNLTPLESSQIYEVASLANSDHDEAVAVDHHRVSFELTGEDVAKCLASKLNRSGLEDGLDEKTNEVWGTKNVCESEKSQKVKSFSLGSSKEFKFDSTKEESVEKNQSPGHGWSFFPLLRSGLS